MAQNRLSQSTSLYLLQHARNPVDWYPWGAEAFDRARAEGRPIFLSIGYSACHWCHVMERESFENEEIADLLNESFVAIKVDREERPDVDRVYMDALMAMGERGGWPLNLFLTPEGEPFYGGTYFPPTPRYGMLSFRELLVRIRELWEEEPERLKKTGRDVARALGAPAEGSTAGSWESAMEKATQHLLLRHDDHHGGFGPAPKFPMPMALLFLLGQDDPRARERALFTLEKMALGGIWDHLGGGFHRYSTDNRWLLPHFEKMLYDNALLAMTYSKALRLTGDDHLERTLRSLLAFLSAQMEDPSGGFYATMDADSEGEEGRYYVWTFDEIVGHLGEERGAQFAAHFGVTREGNLPEREVHLKGKSVLMAKDQKPLFEKARAILLQARTARVAPATDKKIITAWNGLAVAAFARAARTLREESLAEPARRAARRLLGALEEGLLPRSLQGGERGPEGVLEDYAFFALGLLELYKTDLERSWLEACRGIVDKALSLFSKDGPGLLRFTSDETLLHQRGRIFDSAIPSANAVMIDLLSQLGEVYGEPYRGQGAALMDAALAALSPAPQGAATALLAAATIRRRRVVAVVGDGAFQAEVKKILEAKLTPEDLLLFEERGRARPELFSGREEQGVYICREGRCSLPVKDPTALPTALKEETI